MGCIVLFTLEGVVGDIAITLGEGTHVIVLLTTECMAVVTAKVLEDGVADVTATLEEDTHVITLFTIEWVAGVTAEVLEGGVAGIILKEGVADVTATLKDGMAGNMFILLDVTSCCRNGAKCWATPAAGTQTTLSYVDMLQLFFHLFLIHGKKL